MATILSKDLKVKNGQVLLVKNEKINKTRGNEAKTYLVLWFNDVDDIEKCLMFTENEFNKCEKVLGTFNNENKLGYAYSFNLVKAKTNSKLKLIKIQHINSDETCLLITEKLFNKCLARAQKNIEDCPEKGWWTDLID